MVFLALMAATFVSEDLACIAAGLMIHDQRIGAVEGLTACTLGIFLGDVGLWAIGRVATTTALPWLDGTSGRIEGRTREWLDRLPREEMRRWLARNAAGAIVASRFLPGTRLPMHVCAGLFGVPLRVYGLWTLVAVLLWTPVLVLSTAAIGSTAASPLAAATGERGWISQLIVAVAFVLMLRTLRPYAVSGFSRIKWER